jgi:methionine salvage enolase-phosphatase E1
MSKVKENNKKIGNSFSNAPHLFFFVSDAVKEIEAAQSVGMQAILCERDSRASASPTAGGVIRSFDRVLPD